MTSYHSVHIPVMGTGHSIDTPIRVAHFGIDSVISVVDDLLLERIRKHYSEQYGIGYHQISRNAEDGRARRITAHLDLVQEIVTKNFETIKSMSLNGNSMKDQYFMMLPRERPLHQTWKAWQASGDETSKSMFEKCLTSKMRPGSIDVNIMAKVDHLGWDKGGSPLSPEFSDACAALRGFANSVVESAVVLSAGFNPRLYSYIGNFRSFYRDQTGKLRKKIILKVSDFRSALIQGKFLAKNGLEVSEFRIESGLNCGGHAFYSDGKLLPVIMDEFRTKKEELVSQLKPLVAAFYDKMGWEYNDGAFNEYPRITVQGGIGTPGENLRLLNDFSMDGTGWGSPFLLVPEATCVDDPTIDLLINAKSEDLYLSKASPLGIPFNNIRGTGSQKWTSDRKYSEKPGSPCPKGFLKSNTEFTDRPICTASTEYQILKIAQVNADAKLSSLKKAQVLDELHARECLCDHLGNGSLIKLGIIKEKHGPQAICPGPNIAWFNRTYTLGEMMAHIYGKSTSLVPSTRPHMFAKELEMNVDYLEKMMIIADPDDLRTQKQFRIIADNLYEGIRRCEEIAYEKPYRDENLESLARIVFEQKERLSSLMGTIENTMA